VTAPTAGRHGHPAGLIDQNRIQRTGYGHDLGQTVFDSEHGLSLANDFQEVARTA
jgi:hypothetical protein